MGIRTVRAAVDPHGHGLWHTEAGAYNSLASLPTCIAGVDLDAGSRHHKQATADHHPRHVFCSRR